eukprot:873411-Amphidinium_carterae.1
MRSPSQRGEFRSIGVQTEGELGRSVAVQSQCTYKYWLTRPRFSVLPEQSEGAWVGDSLTRGSTTMQPGGMNSDADS